MPHCDLGDSRPVSPATADHAGSARRGGRDLRRDIRLCGCRARYPNRGDPEVPFRTRRAKVSRRLDWIRPVHIGGVLRYYLRPALTRSKLTPDAVPRPPAHLREPDVRGRLQALRGQSVHGAREHRHYRATTTSRSPASRPTSLRLDERWSRRPACGRCPRSADTKVYGILVASTSIQREGVAMGSVKSTCWRALAGGVVIVYSEPPRRLGPT